MGTWNTAFLFSFQTNVYRLAEDNHEGAKDENPIRQVIEEEKGEIEADDKHEAQVVEKNDQVEEEKIILTTTASTKEVIFLGTCLFSIFSSPWCAFEYIIMNGISIR